MNKQIEELFKDLCEAPTGSVNEDFTIGTLKESHTSPFIRTVAGHLVSLNYHKQSEGEWKQVCGDFGWVEMECSVCKYSDVFDDHKEFHKYCPNCGARMKGGEG